MTEPAPLLTPRPVDVAWEMPTPAPDDLEDLEAAGRLFAAAATGLYQPVPVVTLDGVDVASGPGPDGVPAGQLVVDGLSIRWGRTELLEQPDLPVGSLTLFDATRTWAIGRDLLGLVVTIRRQADDWSGGPLPRVFFRGRIDKVKVTPKRAGGVDGSLIQLRLVSTLNELANRKAVQSWPEETLGARAVRVLSACYGVLDAIDLRDYWENVLAAPVASTSQPSTLAHLLSLYESSGADRMAYDPDAQSTRDQPRRDFPTLRGVAGLFWDQTTGTKPTARAGQGAYIRSYAVAASGLLGDPAHLDAGDPVNLLSLDPANGLEQTAESRITRVSITHPNGEDAYRDNVIAALVDKSDEARVGVRVATLNSILTTPAYVQVQANDLRDMLNEEGREWRPPEVHLRVAGGFDTEAIGRILLRGKEWTDLFFVQRSYLSSLYGLRPVYGLMGQTIQYLDGKWEMDLTLSPISTTLPQHAITWEEIDDGSAAYEVQWWDRPHPRGLHESVTYEDLRFCSTGVAVTTVPPDQGWDKTL